MSEHIIRVSLDAVAEQDRTDWTRLRALDDDAIQLAIAADADTFAADGVQTPHYEISKARSGQFRWRLIGAAGEVLAQGATSFPDLERAKAAVEIARAAALHAAAA